MKKGKNNDEPLAGEDEEKVDGLMDLLLIRITSTTKDPFMASDVTQPQLCVSHHSRFKQSKERKKSGEIRWCRAVCCQKEETTAL